MHMFRKESDFGAFERVMVETHQRQPIRILSYCVLSNHWHFVLWPAADGQVTDFFRRLAHTHAVRWRVSHRTVDYGHLYQDRFKSFPVQSDDHLLGLLRRGATKNTPFAIVSVAQSRSTFHCARVTQPAKPVTARDAWWEFTVPG
jgi:REP element-mobilizing transposase RayT